MDILYSIRLIVKKNQRGDQATAVLALCIYVEEGALTTMGVVLRVNARGDKAFAEGSLGDVGEIECVFGANHEHAGERQSLRRSHRRSGGKPVKVARGSTAITVIFVHLEN